MTEFKETELDERAIKMAKVLSADAVERAGHGHPGSPVSLAPVAYTLYQHFIKHDPNDPNWEGRDRFILSGGHASLTQYVQLYFSGYGLTLDDLKNFRGGADTRTPGHPEYGLTPGIEMTTGPLGQGFASAIGFAYGSHSPSREPSPSVSSVACSIRKLRKASPRSTTTSGSSAVKAISKRASPANPPPSPPTSSSVT